MIELIMLWSVAMFGLSYMFYKIGKQKPTQIEIVPKPARCTNCTRKKK